MNSKSVLANRLAKFLRLKGDGVINGTSKLSLTTHALSALNALFNEILLSERHEGEIFHDSRQIVALIEDVQYLLAFVSKTRSLKVHHSGQTLRGGIDISRFANLKVLELHKVPAHLVIGLELLCCQLETVICNRSVCSLKEIFNNCNDESFKDVWIVLTELNVSFNHIDGFDDSFGVLPNITYFDASHNQLEHVDEIQMLEKLVFLDLSYNSLKGIPVLSGLSCYSLKILFLRNNFLEDLNGVDVLINLEELDVRYNCIFEHCALRFLKKLASLKFLCLEDNPIFFHKDHRSLTIHYVNPIAINHLLLDGTMISSNDMMNVPVEEICSTPVVNFHQTSINVVLDEEKMLRYQHLKNTDTGSGNTASTSFKDESSQKSLHLNDSNLLHSAATKKEFNNDMRETLIIDVENVDDKEILNIVIENEEKNIAPHIRTKQLMEKRRKDFKEGWLIAHYSYETLDSEKSLFKVPPNTPITSTLDVCANGSNNKQHLSENILEQNCPIKQTQDIFPETEIASTHIQILPIISTSKENEEIQNFVIEQQDMIQVQRNIKHSTGDTVDNLYQTIGISPSDSHSDIHEDSDAKVFIVRKIDGAQNIDIFIKVTEHFIKELNVISGKVTESLDLRSLISVDMNKKDEDYVLNLNLDSVNTSRQNRQYVVQDEDICDELLAICRPFALAKAARDWSAVGAFHCLKCSALFSKPTALRKFIKPKKPSKTDLPKEINVCPYCGCSVLLDAKQFPTLPKPACIRRLTLASHKNSAFKSCMPKNSHIKRKYNIKKSEDLYSNSTIISNQDLVKAANSCPNLRNYAIVETEFLDIPQSLSVSMSLENLTLALYKDPVFKSHAPKSEHDKKNNEDSNSNSSTIGTDDVPLSQRCPSCYNRCKWECSSTSKCDVCGHLKFSNLLSKKEQFISESFIMIDHRLKLYLENTLFDDDEHLECCLNEISIVVFPMCEKFDGLFAVSNKNVHILKSSINNDSFEGNLKQSYVIPLRQLKIINMLLGSQGFSLAFSSCDKMFLFLVRDADLCNSFISHLGETQEKLLNIEASVISHIEDSLLKINKEIAQKYYPEIMDNANEILLHLFLYCQIQDEIEDMPACIVITWEDIFVSAIQFEKQSKLDDISNLFHYVPFGKQPIKNLIEVKMGQDLLKAELKFHDEDTNICSVWRISTRTRSSLLSCLSEIKKAWERCFQIEMTLCYFKEF